MKYLVSALVIAFATPAMAQGNTGQADNPAPQSAVPTATPSGGFPILSPFQALGKVIQNPTVPPPAPPSTPVSGGPLPTAIPPNTIGTHTDGR